MEILNNLSPAEWINAIATVASFFVGWSAYRLSKQINEKTQPSMRGSALVFNGTWKDDRLFATLELNVVNTGGIPLYITEINWKDGFEDARPINLDASSNIEWPIKIESGASFKKLEELEMPVLKKSQESAWIASWIEFDGVEVEDYANWEIAIHSTTLPTQFIYPLFADFRSAKAFPRYSKEMTYDPSMSQWAWPGLKHLHKELPSLLPNKYAWRYRWHRFLNGGSRE